MARAFFTITLLIDAVPLWMKDTRPVLLALIVNVPPTLVSVMLDETCRRELGRSFVADG